MLSELFQRHEVLQRKPIIFKTWLRDRICRIGKLLVARYGSYNCIDISITNVGCPNKGEVFNALNYTRRITKFMEASKFSSFHMRP